MRYNMKGSAAGNIGNELFDVCARRASLGLLLLTRRCRPLGAGDGVISQKQRERTRGEVLVWYMVRMCGNMQKM
jgi:hypothetical protein